MNAISPKQVQGNFITYFRLFEGLPGITFVEEDEITWIVGQEALGNMILSTEFSVPRTSRQIDGILYRIGQHTDLVDWFVFPGCQPNDLGKQLKSYGEAGGTDNNWMIYGNIGVEPGTWMQADLTTLPASPSFPHGFHVKQVSDQGMLDQWAEINAKGFGSTGYSTSHAAYSRHGFGVSAQAIHFIGFLDNKPVTSATLLIAGGSASVYNVSTPTELRQQGFGGAITHAALLYARDVGYQASWIWSSDLGKSVYAKLGFIQTDFGIREYQWKKTTTYSGN